MNSESDHNINSSSRYHPSEFCTKLNYVYTTRQCDEYFEYLAELRKIIFGHNYPDNMLAGAPPNSNSIHYHTNCGKTLVYQVDDVSEYGIKLSSSQISARTETLITDTYYAEEHVLTLPETSEIIPPKLCHQLPSTIREPMGNCVHPSSKVGNNVFPYSKEIHETATIACNEPISQSYLSKMTIEKEQMDYEHDFYNYESHFKEPGNLIDGVDETFAVNEEFANVLEETDSVFEEQNDDTIEDTCTISDDKVNRIVGIVTRHTDTRDISPTLLSLENDDAGETSSRTPTGHSYPTEHQYPESTSYDSFVLDNAEHEFPMRADFQLPSIFSNRSKTSSVENLRRNNSEHFEQATPSIDFIPTNASSSPEGTTLTSSVDSPRNNDSTSQEPEILGNSVLVNMIEDYVKMVMEASRELNHSANGETPQEIAPGFPSSSYSSSANISDSATNSHKLDISDRIENETFNRDTGKPEIENAGVEFEMNRNHESEIALTLATRGDSSYPETGSSDEDSDSCSVNTIVEVSGKDQRSELESPVFEKGGFLPVAPRKSSVEKWESVTLKSELEHKKHEDENDFFRDSELKIEDLKNEDIKTPGKGCQKSDKHEMSLEFGLNQNADEKEEILTEDANDFLIPEQGNCGTFNNVDSEENAQSASTSSVPNHNAELENVIISEAENIEQRSGEFQNIKSVETENNLKDDPKKIESIFGEENFEKQTVIPPESRESTSSKNGLLHCDVSIEDSALNSNSVSGETDESLTGNKTSDKLADSFSTDLINTAVEDNLEGNSYNEPELFDEDILEVVKNLLHVVSEALDTQENATDKTTRTQNDFHSSFESKFQCSEITEIEQIVEEVCLEKGNNDQEASPQQNPQEDWHIDVPNKIERSEFEAADCENSEILNNSSSSGTQSSHGFTDSYISLHGLPTISSNSNDVTSRLEDSDSSYQETRETEDSHEQPVITQFEVLAFDKQVETTQENDLILGTEPIVVNTSDVDVGKAEKFQESQTENFSRSSATISESALNECHSTFSYQPVGGSSISDGIKLIDVIHCEPEEQKLFLSINQEEAETRLESESFESLESKIHTFFDPEDIEMAEIEACSETNSGFPVDFSQTVDDIQQFNKVEQDLISDSTIEDLLNCLINKLEDNSKNLDELIEGSTVYEKTGVVTTETINFESVSEFVKKAVIQEDCVVPVEAVPLEFVEQAKCGEKEEMIVDIVKTLVDAVEMHEDTSEVLENIIEGMAEFVNQGDTFDLDTTVLAMSQQDSKCELEGDDVKTVMNFLRNMVDETHHDTGSEGSHSTNVETQEYLTNCAPYVNCDEAVVGSIQELLASVSQNLEEMDDSCNFLNQSTSSTPSTSGSEEGGIMTAVKNQERDDRMNPIQDLVEYLLEKVTNNSNDGHRLFPDYLNGEELSSEKDINKPDQEDISDVLKDVLIGVDGSSNEDNQLAFDNPAQCVFEQETGMSEENVANIIEDMMELVCSGSEIQETGDGSVGQRRDSDNTAQKIPTGSNENREFVENDDDVIEDSLDTIFSHLNAQEQVSFATNSECIANDSSVDSNSNESELNNSETSKFCFDEVKDYLEQILQKVCSEAGISIQESDIRRKRASEDDISSETGMNFSNEDNLVQPTTITPYCQEINENTILDATPEIEEILQSVIEELLQNSMRWNYANQEMNYENEELLEMSQNAELDVFEDSGFCDVSAMVLDSIDDFQSVSNVDDSNFYHVPSDVYHDDNNTENFEDRNCEDEMEFVTTRDEKDGSEVNQQAEGENNMQENENFISVSKFDSVSNVVFENVKEESGVTKLSMGKTMENDLKTNEKESATTNGGKTSEKVCPEIENDDMLHDSFGEEKSDKVCLDHNSNGIGIRCEKETTTELSSLESCFTEDDSNACLKSGTTLFSFPEVLEARSESDMDDATSLNRYVENLIQDQLCIALSNAIELISRVPFDQPMAPDTYSPTDAQLNPDQFNISQDASIFMTPVDTILKADVENVDETDVIFNSDNSDFHRKEAIDENTGEDHQFLQPRCVGTTDETSDVIVANLEVLRTNGNPLKTLLEENQTTFSPKNELPADAVEYISSPVPLLDALSEIVSDSSEANDNVIETTSENELSYTDHPNIECGLSNIDLDREPNDDLRKFEEGLPKPLSIGPKTRQFKNCITTQHTPTTTSDTKHEKDVTIEAVNVLHQSSSDISPDTHISKGEISDDCDDTTGSKIKHLNEAETSKHEYTESSTPTPPFGTEHLVLSSDVTPQNVHNLHPEHIECNKDNVEYVPTNTSLKLPVETSSTESSLKPLEQPSTSLVLEEVSHFLTTACVVALAFMSPSESTSSALNPDIIEDVSKYFSEEDANDADKN
ncbi:unnamed protein product [Caenorhabditis brenneri]